MGGHVQHIIWRYLQLMHTYTVFFISYAEIAAEYNIIPYYIMYNRPAITLWWHQAT